MWCGEKFLNYFFGLILVVFYSFSVSSWLDESDVDKIMWSYNI